MEIQQLDGVCRDLYVKERIASGVRVEGEIHRLAILVAEFQ